MSDITVLILEDEKHTLLYLAERIAKLGVDLRTEDNPQKWVSRIQSERYNIVLTDLMKDTNHEVRPGDDVVEEIFRHNFVPIVVHSAYAGLGGHFPQYQKHPFLKIVPKSDKSVDEVEQHVRSFLPLARSLNDVRAEVQRALDTTLTRTAEAIAGIVDPVTALPHLVRRRIAATFDTRDEPTKKLVPIERYLVPPLAASLLAGDILHRKADADRRADECRIVLTQSCDLTWDTKRKPKVKQALVAAPAAIDELVKRIPVLQKLQAGNAKPDDKAITGACYQLCSCSHEGGLFALPGVPGWFADPLVFDLKQLELIDLADIQSGCADARADYDWERIASQDSPFREQITWALISLFGRPALPDVDHAGLMDLLLKQVAGSKK